MGFSIFIMIWLMLHQVFLYSGVQGQEDVPCIDNYEQLKAALFNKETNNVQNLLYTFYPLSKETVHFVNITYCLAMQDYLYDNSTSCSPDSLNITYHWAVNGLLVKLEPELVSALALNLITFNMAEVVLIINQPFCSNDAIDPKKLLDTLTSWVSVPLPIITLLYSLDS